MTLLIPLAYVMMSAATFIMFWLDKRAAMRGGWRTPETTLHIMELLGGFPGAIAAQRLLRHKSYKLSYRVVLWLIVALHAGGWIAWWLLR